MTTSNKPRTPEKSELSYVKFSDQLTGTLDQITRMVNEQKQNMDTLQEMGIHLAGAFGTLHTLTVKYAGIVNKILDTLLPFLQKVPFVPDKLLDMAVNIEKVTQQIIDNNEKTSRAIADVDAGLRKGDMSKLSGFSDEIQKMTTAFKTILPDIK